MSSGTSPARIRSANGAKRSLNAVMTPSLSAPPRNQARSAIVDRPLRKDSCRRPGSRALRQSGEALPRRRVGARVDARDGTLEDHAPVWKRVEWTSRARGDQRGFGWVVVDERPPPLSAAVEVEVGLADRLRIHRRETP